MPIMDIAKSFLLLLVMTLTATYGLYAQDEPVASSGNNDLAGLVRQWELLDSQIGEKAAAFKAATDPAVTEDLRGQYTALVEQSTELIGQIKAKATQNLNNGTTDAATCKILIGLVMNDAEFERNNEASTVADKMVACGVDGSLFEKAAKVDRLSVFSKELFEEMFIRSNQKKQDDLPHVKIITSKGELVVELFEDEAPNSVANFVSLVEDKFYDGLKFHRVVEGFVAQGGDPNGNGSGGPGYSIKCECDSPDARRHFLGSLSMAHAGKDTGGSQFFLCLNRTSHLDGRHTVFGRVIEGIEVLDKLSRNMTPSGAIEGADTDSIESMTVIRKRDHEYQPEKIGDEDKESAPEPPPSQPESKNDDAAEAIENRETPDDAQTNDG